LLLGVGNVFVAASLHEPFPVELAGHELAAREDQRTKPAGGAELLLTNAREEVAASEGAKLVVKSVDFVEAVTVGERGVEQATETLRVERERHEAGRATTNDLPEAEPALRNRRTIRDVAKLEVVRAWVRLWLVMGEFGVFELA
jgi:hypothetical protein